jgi:hypothetical protein
VLLIGGVDLPDLVRVLRSVLGRGVRPTGWGRGQAVPPEPALERPHLGERGPRVHSAQLDPDAPGAPAGVEAAELEGGLHQRRGCRGVAPTAVIAGLQGGGVGIGPRLKGPSHQAPDRALGQVELAGDV